ncbi:MAG TPA: site-specific DNA-methyltransferase [Pyrinomonadaceae bacterium]|jgi:DNA modification methylase|nr:site-specific DNA-methyltransferase [Pyrinomonadaceae bacterium]
MTSPALSKSESSVADKFKAKYAALAKSPALLNSQHRVILGDARSMNEVQDKSIHLVVTSPPYWILKEYDGGAGKAQLGHLRNYEDFHSQLDHVWQRCFDALVPGGRLCVVVGDVCLARRKTGRHLVVPVHADISIRCLKFGFDYLTPILWYKIANATTEVEGNGSPFLGKPYEPNGIIKNDIEYVLLFRKPGGYRKPTNEQRVLSLIEKDKHSLWFRSIWNDIPGASRGLGHPAPYPVEIAYRLVNMFSFVGDTVLDPFLGTGTTTEAAIRANRSSIGYEVERKYFDIVKRRFAQLRSEATVRFD